MTRQIVGCVMLALNTLILQIDRYKKIDRDIKILDRQIDRQIVGCVMLALNTLILQIDRHQIIDRDINLIDRYQIIDRDIKIIDRQIDCWLCNALNTLIL